MKYTVYHSNIERVVYEFDKSDIQKALINFFKVSVPQSAKIELEICEDYFDDYKNKTELAHVELTIRYEHSIEKEEPKTQ